MKTQNDLAKLQAVSVSEGALPVVRR
jgi:hypothetical protein